MTYHLKVWWLSCVVIPWHSVRARTFWGERNVPLAVRESTKALGCSFRLFGLQIQRAQRSLQRFGVAFQASEPDNLA